MGGQSEPRVRWVDLTTDEDREGRWSLWAARSVRRPRALPAAGQGRLPPFSFSVDRRRPLARNESPVMVMMGTQARKS
jgi:hypothetical protein